MRRDARAFLWDVADQVGQALRFVAGHSREDYLDNELLRAAVERKLQNAGEALSQLRSLAPELAARVPEHRQVIGFRNVLVHNYQGIDNHAVWNVLEQDAPALISAVQCLVAELDAADKGQ